MIARVAPEDKVRLVDLLKRKGDIVAMTGDGVNDAPALKRADIGIAMGITGTEVSKEAAAMILTDDNFATIVKAVELGRGLYDNLTKYVRFQMGCLFGFIVTFLGAGIFNIVGGVPFLPLQTLWINFTTQLFQAIGLGYGKPTAGLMEREPRQPDRPILTRGGFAWLASAGLVMGVGTLGVTSWAEQVHTEAIAHTMGVVTFSLYALFFSIETRDERRTAFSLDTFSDSKFVIATGVSLPDAPPDHRLRPAPGVPQDHQPRCPAVVDMPGRGAIHRSLVRDRQGLAAAHRTGPPRNEVIRMPFGVHSEVGTLRKVMVHRPGLEHSRLTPGNCCSTMCCGSLAPKPSTTCSRR